jgi:hypothetical protein
VFLLKVRASRCQPWHRPAPRMLSAACGQQPTHHAWAVMQRWRYVLLPRVLQAVCLLLPAVCLLSSTSAPALYWHELASIFAAPAGNQLMPAAAVSPACRWPATCPCLAWCATPRSSSTARPTWPATPLPTARRPSGSASSRRRAPTACSPTTRSSSCTST